VRWLVVTIFTIETLGLGLLTTASNVPVLLFSQVVWGISHGGSQVLAELAWANYYGRTFLGAIRGIVTPFYLISTFGGSFVAGWVYDVTGSYQGAFVGMMITNLLAAALVAFARPPRAR